jgi:hypothetical protein
MEIPQQVAGAEPGRGRASSEGIKGFTDMCDIVCAGARMMR